MAEENKPEVSESKKPADQSPETLSKTPQDNPESDVDANLSKIRSRNFVILTKYIAKQGIDPWVFLHITKETLNRISLGKQNADFFAVWRMQRASLISPIARFETAKKNSQRTKTMASSNGPPNSAI